jgi:cathepsin D
LVLVQNNIFDKGGDFDAIVGMAYKPLASKGQVPFVDQLIDQKLIEKNLFAFYFSFSPKNEKSELTLGFYDKHRYQGSLSWHKVTNPNFFVLDLIDVRLGDKSLGLCIDKHCSVTPDTGTSDLTFPRWALDQLEIHPLF